MLIAATRGWLPIYCAPRDGTIIDVWCQRSWDAPVQFERRTNVYWCTTHHCWRTVGNAHFVEPTFKPGLTRERWLIPVQWMPLPAEPHA